MTLIKVLIVDDSTLDLFVIAQVLRHKNVAKEILTYKSPIEALEYLKSIQHSKELYPGLMFLDMYMPSLTGIEFLNTYVSLSQHLVEFCPVILLTASYQTYDDLPQKYPCVKRVVVKPINQEAVDEILSIL